MKAASVVHGSKPRGSALIVALAVVVLLSSLSTVLLESIRTRARSVETDLEDMRAFEAAETGLDAAIHHINNAPLTQVVINGVPQTAPGNANRKVEVHVPLAGCIGTRTWTKAAHDLDGDGRPTWKNSPLSNGRFCESNIIPESLLGETAYFTYAIHWLNDGIDNNGDGPVDDMAERNKYTVYSTGIYHGSYYIINGQVVAEPGEFGKVVTVEAIVEAPDINLPIWTKMPFRFNVSNLSVHGQGGSPSLPP